MCYEKDMLKPYLLDDYMSCHANRNRINNDTTCTNSYSSLPLTAMHLFHKQVPNVHDLHQKKNCIILITV